MSLLNLSLRKTISTVFGFFLLLASFAPISAFAQSPFSAAYRVNSSVITYYEIDQMSRLLVELGRGQDDQNTLAVETLINDRLLRQETARYNMDIDPILIDRALDNISDGDGAGLRAKLNQKGIANETIETYVGSQILLRSYLDMRGIKVDVSPEEVASRINAIPDQVTPTIHIAEIVMPYAEYGGRIPTRLKFTEVKKQLASGVPFSTIAREVSRASTASNGGRLPEIPKEGLTPQLASMIKNLRPGQIAQPLETEGAIILIQYVGTGEIRNSLPRSEYVSYIELFVPAREGLEKSKSDAANLSRKVGTCDHAKAIKGATIKENVPVTQLSSGLSLALARLETGENALFERENGTSVLYLCDLGVAVPNELQAGVNNMVSNEAMDARSRGVLQELRNIAIIERVQ